MENNPINPDHYKQNGIEAIDKLKQELSHDEYIGYLKGNAFKYIFRTGHKGGPEDWQIDIEKAIWYLNKLRSTIV